MTFEIAIVYGIILAALVLFASDRMRLDVVALLALLALALTGILSPDEALAGFADPVVLMIAGLFVVGDGLFQTGVAARLARLPARIAGDSEVRLLGAIMLIVALLSGFMSSTGTVAVMLPVVMGLAWERGIQPSRLLIPLSVAALLGGMLTLIGTAPNIVVSNQLAAVGREPFGFFTFTPVGAVMLVAGLTFMVLIGRRMLPDRTPPGTPRGGGSSVAELASAYGLPETLQRVRIPASSPLAGARLRDAELRSRYDVNVVDIRTDAEPVPAGGPRRGLQARLPGSRTKRENAESRPVLPDTVIAAGDMLLLHARPEAVAALAEQEGLEPMPAPGSDPAFPSDVGLVEVMLTPRSSLIGRTLSDAKFREKYRVTVLGARRLGHALDEKLSRARLRFGDSLLVKGPWSNIRLLQAEDRDFVVATRPRELEDAGRPYHRAPVAGAIMLGMLLLMTFGLVAPVTAVLLAAVAMVLSRCVGIEDAYRSIHWESVVLIAAVLPMATALQKTGGLDLVVAGLDNVLGDAGPLIVLAALFLLTSALSQVISNTATAVLLAPIAVQLAFRLEIAPEPFLMGIAVAASTAFATPVASPVNVLVMGPGGYRFTDFLRVGLWLQLVIFVATMLVVPWLFPFGG